MGLCKMPAKRRLLIPAFSLVLALLFCLNGKAEEHRTTLDNLLDTPLEELLKVTVTSVAKTEQRLQDAMGAIFVITSEDIRRNGANSVAETLRMVPGLHVAQSQAGFWNITARGFNDLYANKLLVLVDGRSIYSPLYSGVEWYHETLPLYDIDRIEVIRGPGAALWGINAVNGVINIITKHSRESQGWYVSGGKGNEEAGFGDVRYGGTVGENVSYRLYGRYLSQENSVDAKGNEMLDSFWSNRAGFRIDGRNENNKFMLDGAIQHTEQNLEGNSIQLIPPFQSRWQREEEGSAAHLLGRWQHSFAADSDLILQMYYDRTEREDESLIYFSHDIVDLDVQHSFSISDSNKFLWGVEYRYVDAAADNERIVRSAGENRRGLPLDPEDRADRIASAFIQDEQHFFDNTLRLIAGTKFEHTSYAGAQLQPNVRLLWSPNNNHTFWGAISRAVRGPSRAEQSIRINAQPIPDVQGLPGEVSILGNPDFSYEKLIAYEVGYRTELHSKVTLDATSFFNEYDDLRTFEPRTPFFEADPSPHIVVPFQAANLGRAKSYGGELLMDWGAASWLKLQGWYSYLVIDTHLQEGGRDTTFSLEEKKAPRHQFGLRSKIDLPYRVQWDSGLRYVDALRALGVDSYVELGTRVGWFVTDSVELSLHGQNLLRKHHSETGQTLLGDYTADAERSVWMKATYRF